MSKQISFHECVQVSPNIIAAIAVYFGWTCSPSYHLFGKCNKKGHFDE